VATPAPRLRRPSIDWLRGVAVVIMVLAHTMDAWTRDADRPTALYGLVVKIAGMGAPLFLFLAGVSVALAAGSRARATGDTAAAAASVQRRGWEIFAFAFLFRLQSWTIGLFRAPAASLLKVDILNIMGPAIVLAAAFWQGGRRPATRFAWLTGATVATALLTPLVRGASFLAVLPDPLEWYLRPPPGRSWFTMFPWAGLLFAGGAVGVLLDEARDADRDRRLNLRFLGWGTALMAASFAGSYLPSIFANSSFWTTSPSYFFLRIGLMVGALGLAWLWCRRPTAHRWSPMLVLGTSSLFIYWVHIEVAYGSTSAAWRHALPIWQAVGGFLLLTGVMLVAALVKNRVAAAWRARRRRSVAIARS
jgi:uncharacterized membrane protein